MRFARPLLVLAAVLALVAAGCGGSSKKVSKDAVALVGDTTITRVQFNELLRQAQLSYAAQNRPFPKAGSPEYIQLQNQAMTFLVQRAEFAQKANALGINVTDKQVNDRLAQIKKQYFGGVQKRYEAQLQAQGLSDEQVHADLKAQLVSEAIFKKVTAGVTVTDQEITTYYAQHPQQYSQPQSRDVRHILVKDRKTADKLYAQLRSGGDFGALAKRFSQDPGSKNQGGRLTIAKGQTVPPFDKVAFALKINELSKPVKTQFGWHVIEALSPVRPRQTTPLTQVREAIRQQLLQQQRSQAMTKWVDDVKKDFSSKVRYQTGFAPPSTDTTPPQPAQPNNNGGNA